MTAPAAFTFATRTDVGRQRDGNEDAYAEREAAGGQLLIVCDGMGGHEAGEVASRIAADTIGQIFENSTEDDPGERLRRGFLVANQRILKHADEHGLDRMGTTAVATFVRDGEAWIAHVGDSRVYQLRGGAVLWRTSDHTRVQRMVERGILTADEAKHHEDANIVTRALGFARGEEAPEPDVAARPLREGDTLLLCSDGLHDLVTDDELAELASYGVPGEVSETLVELANRRGGHDNITVGVLRWGATAQARPAGARRTALEFGAEPPPSVKATRREAAGAAAIGDEPRRPRRAAALVLAGVGLLGVAAAVYLLTRGGGAAPDVVDAAMAPADASAALDAPDAAADAADDALPGVDAGAPPSLPSWAPEPPKPARTPGAADAGMGAGSGSGSGSGSGAGSGTGSGSASGSASGSGSGSGSGSASGSGSGSGSASGAATGATKSGVTGRRPPPTRRDGGMP